MSSHHGAVAVTFGGYGPAVSDRVSEKSFKTFLAVGVVPDNICAKATATGALHGL
jgi:hypothetical protein